MDWVIQFRQSMVDKLQANKFIFELILGGKNMKIGDRVLCVADTDKTKNGNHYIVTEVLRWKYKEKQNIFTENKATKCQLFLSIWGF